MDSNSFYLAMRGESLDKMVKPGLRQTYEVDKKDWLAINEFYTRHSYA